MTVHFTADTHFRHGNIIRYCHRPFKSVEEMDRKMQINWNQRVKPEDTVYVIGDFMFTKKNGSDVAELLRSLNGKKHLIVGNHDRKSVTDCPEWESVQPHLVKSIHGVKVHMYHYPTFSWDCAVHGSWMVHGHCHNGLCQYPEYVSVDWDALKIQDVGVDAWGFRPVSFYELKDRMDRKCVRSREIDWRNAANNIPDAECVDGTTYWISARNGQIGVYNRKTQGFMLVRNKFGHEFVDTEFHWDLLNIHGTPLRGTVRPLQRLERCPVKFGDDGSYNEADMFAYLKEADTRFCSSRYSELVWACRQLADGGYLSSRFEDEENAVRYRRIVKLDTGNEDVLKSCGRWARVELTVGHAMQRLKHGVKVDKEFFDGHEPSYSEYLARLSESGHNPDVSA
jgi:calcineurin-like phosphoesterase family protein